MNDVAIMHVLKSHCHLNDPVVSECGIDQQLGDVRREVPVIADFHQHPDKLTCEQGTATNEVMAAGKAVASIAPSNVPHEYIVAMNSEKLSFCCSSVSTTASLKPSESSPSLSGIMNLITRNSSL